MGCKVKPIGVPKIWPISETGRANILKSNVNITLERCSGLSVKNRKDRLAYMYDKTQNALVQDIVRPPKWILSVPAYLMGIVSSNILQNFDFKQWIR